MKFAQSTQCHDHMIAVDVPEEPLVTPLLQYQGAPISNEPPTGHH